MVREPLWSLWGDRSMDDWYRQLDIRGIGGRYGTPVYVFCPERFEKNFRGYLALVDRPDRIKYPVKANPSLESSINAHLAI